jgi:hypothetical protein
LWVENKNDYYEEKFDIFWHSSISFNKDTTNNHNEQFINNVADV